MGPLDNDLLEDLKRVEREEAAQARVEAGPTAGRLDGAGDRVEPLHRLGAAAFDVAMLGSIAAFVFWATLRLCAVGLSGLGAGALVPLIAFLVMMDVGYLFMFTAAGGQTVGKMLMGIRVIDDGTDDGDQVSVRQATWRAALTIVSLGLGLAARAVRPRPRAARSTGPHPCRARMKRLAVWLATSGGLGYAPVAPGTVGSAAGLLVYFLTSHWSLPAQVALAGGVTLVGVWASGIAAEHFGRPDPSPVVIDEVAGQLVTLLGTGAGWKGALAGFFLFRALDIIKPWPANRLEALHGGVGIVADDIMAAVYGCAILHAALWVVPGLR